MSVILKNVMNKKNAVDSRDIGGRGRTRWVPNYETHREYVHVGLMATSVGFGVLRRSRQLLLHCSIFARPWARISCIPAVVSPTVP